jgi:UDP-glucose 4-epimerase
MNILISGGAGYIGSQISYDLIDKGHNITIVDNLSTGSKLLVSAKADFYKCDIDNIKILKLIFKKKKIDLVIHLAAYISVEESIKRPRKYLYNNYYKTKKFINFCIKNNIFKFIFSSTAVVYKPSNFKLSENSLTKPQNPYGISKLLCEQFLIKKKNIMCIILRYFNVAGADLKLRTGPISNYKSTHLIKKIINIYFNNKKKLTIYGNNYNTMDGTAIRDYIHINDLSLIHEKCIKYLLKKKRNKIIIFNCGYGKGLSVLDVISSAKKIFNLKHNYGKKRKGDPSSLVANNTKLRKELKLHFKIPNLKKILISGILWQKNYLKKYKVENK